MLFNKNQALAIVLLSDQLNWSCAPTPFRLCFILAIHRNMNLIFLKENEQALSKLDAFSSIHAATKISSNRFLKISSKWFNFTDFFQSNAWLICKVDQEALSKSKFRLDRINFQWFSQQQKRGIIFLPAVSGILQQVTCEIHK